MMVYVSGINEGFNSDIDKTHNKNNIFIKVQCINLEVALLHVRVTNAHLRSLARLFALLIKKNVHLVDDMQLLVF